MNSTIQNMEPHLLMTRLPKNVINCQEYLKLAFFILLSPLSLVTSVLAQNNPHPIIPPSTDFSHYEKKFPAKLSAQSQGGEAGKKASENHDESKVGGYTLPDMFALNNGKKITTSLVWERQRRGELLELYRREVYGSSPPKPDTLTFRIVEIDPKAMGGTATLKRIAIEFKLAGEAFFFHLTLFVPNTRAGRSPVFLMLNHRDADNTDPSRKIQSEFWPVEYAIGRGYAMATINVSAEVEPDMLNATNGVRAFYRRHYAKPNELTWATLSAWAWSGSRAMDYFETDPDINSAQVAVIGHSRGGKTSLWDRSAGHALCPGLRPLCWGGRPCAESSQLWGTTRRHHEKLLLLVRPSICHLRGPGGKTAD